MRLCYVNVLHVFWSCPLSADPYDCPPGWKRHGQLCYYFSAANDKVNWLQAEAKCAQLGGDLAFIANSDAQSFITSKVNAETIKMIIMHWRLTESKNCVEATACHWVVVVIYCNTVQHHSFFQETYKNISGLDSMTGTEKELSLGITGPKCRWCVSKLTYDLMMNSFL